MDHRSGCRRDDHPHIGRRELLQAGGLGLFGATLGDLFRLESHAAPRTRARSARAKAVIFIFQFGGPSQHETWDPKPDAPLKSAASMARPPPGCPVSGFANTSPGWQPELPPPPDPAQDYRLPMPQTRYGEMPRSEPEPVSERPAWYEEQVGWERWG
jgi:hypothetical protein